MQAPPATIKFRATRMANPETIAKLFAPLGHVKRVTRELLTRAVLWEDDETLKESRQSTDATYPEVAVEIADNLPVEIAVIGSFSPGEGDVYIRRSLELQKGHATFVDEYNEASAKIANSDFVKNDPTTVYTFSVGTKDLVFHRHEGHRAISCVTGSGGAVMRFSGCTPEAAARDPEAFVDKMFIVELPSDSLFVLRFHGTVYHQFGPKVGDKDAFFAISVHTNEAGGLSGELLDIVKAGGASIPLLTEPITDNVAELLDHKSFKKMKVKDRRRRTVSATKRYMVRTKEQAEHDVKRKLSKGGELLEAQRAKTKLTTSGGALLGNHPLAPQAITEDIAGVLAREDIMSRVPVFQLPRVGLSSSEDDATWVVEFREPEAVTKIIEAGTSLQLDGRLLEIQKI